MLYQLLSTAKGQVLILAMVGILIAYLLGYYHGLGDAKNHKILLRRINNAINDLLKRHH
jgi:hypothetical protein